MARLGTGRLAATARQLRMVSHKRARLKWAGNSGQQLRYHAAGLPGTAAVTCPGVCRPAPP